MSSPKIPARMIALDRDYFLAVWHETVISVFRGEAALQHVLTISKTCRALLDERRADVSYVSVIERSSPAPSETVRRELAAWSRDVVTKLAVAVMVAEGGGFKNALVRGVGVALTLLAPHKVPFKFTGTVEEAAELVAPFLAEKTGGAAALSLAIADLRQSWEEDLRNGVVG